MVSKSSGTMAKLTAGTHDEPHGHVIQRARKHGYFICVHDVAFAPAHNRSYEDLLSCLIEESDDTFVDADWTILDKVKIVESKEEFPKGWRLATMYQLRVDPKRVCLYFGDKEYEGIVAHT